MPQLQVVKIGTSSIFRDGAINYAAISDLGYDLARLRYDMDTHSVLVVSGAIPLGMQQKGLTERPKNPTELQSCARIGQPLLMHTYSVGLRGGYRGYLDYTGIDALELLTGQYLVTYHNLDNNGEMRNIVANLMHDADNGIVPIINYNDGVDPTEVTRDNDTLAARIAKAMIADRLVILTDVGGLLDEHGNLIYRVSEINEAVRALAGEGNGTGGMKTKLDAAQLLLPEGIPIMIGGISNGLVNIIVNDKMRTLIQK